MNRHRLTTSAALALALGAIAAPSAVAQQDLRNPDQQFPAPPTQEPRQDLRMPDTRDYAEGRGSYNAPEVVVVEKPQSQATPGGGIDWEDVGIGAGGLLGIGLLGAGGALVVVHRRHAKPAGA